MEQTQAPSLDHATILNDALLWSRITQRQFDQLLEQEVGPDAQVGVDLTVADTLLGRTDADGDLVLLVGFGAGMTSASAVLRWGAE